VRLRGAAPARAGKGISVASLVSNRGELFPPPQNSGAILKAWREFSDRLDADAGRAAAGVESARREGAGLARSNANTEARRSEIKQGVSAADPRAELQTVGEAAQNSPGVSAQLSDARSKAEDPDTDPGRVDFEEAERVAEREAASIRGDAGELSGYPRPDEGTPPQI